MNGCHLKSVAGGCLLAAVARDDNNQIVPAAYDVVRVECKSHDHALIQNYWNLLE